MTNDNALNGTVESMNSKLNREQRLAAETTNGPVLVIAGAGAGKTTTLIHRVATLMKKGVQPGNLMVVTFTNAAAEEIRERLRTMVGENARHIVAGTFHSIAWRKILQRWPDAKYLQENGIDIRESAIIDEKDTATLMKESIAELSPSDLEQIADNEWKLRDFTSIISLRTAKGMDLEDFVNKGIVPGSDNEQLYRITSRIWGIFNTKCREVNGVAFDDILLFSSKLLREEPSIGKELSQEFKYLMLDEYQDTNPVQMDIMDSIAQHHRNIFAVGDEKQSIYGFRGSDINVILGFKDRYPESVQVDIVNNYRCNSGTLGFANAIASNMGQRLNDGQLSAEKKEAFTRPYVKGFETDKDEINAIASSIERLLQRGVPGKELAVLFRNRSFKRKLEHGLRERDIEYQLIGDVSFFQKKEVKDVVGFLRFIFRPWDSMAGLRTIGACSFNLSTDKSKRLMHEGGKSLINVIKDLSQKRKAIKKKGGGESEYYASSIELQRFLKTSSILREMVEAGDSPARIRDNLEMLWDKFMREKLETVSNRDKSKAAGQDIEERLENVSYILERFRTSLEKGVTIDEIIEDLTLMIEGSHENKDEVSNRVKLMTVHASKGLEFDYVYCIGVDDQTYPGQDDDPDSIEEARRGLYVATTRAKKGVSITWADKRIGYQGEWEVRNKSRFVDEAEKIIHFGVSQSAVKPRVKKPMYEMKANKNVDHINRLSEIRGRVLNDTSSQLDYSI